MSAQNDEMQMVIPSDFMYLGAVDAAAQDLARELSCSQRWINDFSTALVEACTNAIEHGNKYAKDKQVKVVITVNGRKIVARVHDQGTGFDYEHYLSDETTPDPLSERGRGILIMRAFTDDLSYSRLDHGGVCIQLVKDCDDESDASAEGA